jgi:hypothetical protein
VRVSRLRKATITAARLLTQGLQRGGFRFRVVFETLTYADVQGWQAGHLERYINARRKWAARLGFTLRYDWVAELQKRGAVHYHVMHWLPRGRTLPKADKRGIWPHGHTQREWAKNPVGYMAKYASKADDAGEFPRGLRLHGRGGLDDAQRRVLRWWLLPTYVRDTGGSDADWMRRPGGGYVARSSGEWVHSGWVFSGAADGKVMLVKGVPRDVRRSYGEVTAWDQAWREEWTIQRREMFDRDRVRWIVENLGACD